MKKGLFIAVLSVIVIAPLALPLLAHAYNPPSIWDPNILTKPIISCTGTGDGPAALPACQSLCDLIYTVINIVYYLIAVVLWILSPVLIAVGGVMYMTAGASAENVGRAKKTLTGTIIGIFIVLFSWLIINTFITFLGIAGIGGFGNNSACTVAAPTQGPAGGPGGSFF